MDFDTSRSGTAPSLSTARKMSDPGSGGVLRRGGPESGKRRPSTRGPGAADIADLNASLRHDRVDGNSSASAYSEAVESYREAICSWGDTEAEADGYDGMQPKASERFKQPKSTYGNPSKNRPRIFMQDLDNEKEASGNYMSSKVANVSAIYGAGRKPKNPVPFSRRSDVSKSRQLPSRSGMRPESPMTGTSSNISSSGFDAPPKKIHRPPYGAESGGATSGTSTSAVKRISSPRGFSSKVASVVNRNSNSPVMKGDYNIESIGTIQPPETSPTPADIHSSPDGSVLSPNPSVKLIVETSAILETSQPPIGSKSGRPQSRKLYLGAGVSSAGASQWSPSTSTTRRSTRQALDLTADPFSSSAPVSPKSYITLSPTNFSPKAFSAISIADGMASPKQSPKLKRNKSFPEVMPAPWTAEEGLDDRPPSRQGTAFPFHLAGSNGEPDMQLGVSEDRGTRVGLSGSASTPIFVDSDSTTPISTSISPRLERGKASPEIIFTVHSGDSAPPVGLAPSAAASSGGGGDKRRGPQASASSRPTTRGGSHSLASSPISSSFVGSTMVTNASAIPAITTTEWAPVYDPVADGFSDIIPDGPPTFTIEVMYIWFKITHISVNFQLFAVQQCERGVSPQATACFWKRERSRVTIVRKNGRRNGHH